MSINEMTIRNFDFYEFAGILAPGATALTGILLIAPNFTVPDLIRELSVGGLGLFAIFAYVVGHLVQGLGNGIEWAWWRLYGGLPTDWVRTKPNRLLAPAQLSAMEGLLKKRLGLGDIEISRTTEDQWAALTRQIYAAVAGAGRAGRLDVLNGNYGLHRGIGAALLLVLATGVASRSVNCTFVGGTLAGLALAMFRMHRFGRSYARELFVQFLQLSPNESERKGT